MERLDLLAPRALRAALDMQPVTSGKVLLAWSLAAGPTLAQATTATWRPDDSLLLLQAKSPAWREEVTRARPMLLARMAALLGSNVVRTLAVSTADGPGRDERASREMERRP